MGQQELYTNRFFDHDNDPFDEIAAKKKKAAERIRRFLTLLLAIATIVGGTLLFLQNKNELLLGRGSVHQSDAPDHTTANLQ
ncbi:MAG: hypothetical protein ABGZ53_34690 [Fuerstiella sp.]